jgi:GAF domain-containing protein
LGATVATLTVLLYLNQKQLSQSQDTHFQSYLLADELRQSSDDLTRLARTYVATGDEEYERQYWAVLDIRNGKSPRPVAYNRIYWDFISGTGRKPRLDGPAISLRDLMIQRGFTDAEFEKLTQSQRNSDALIKAETIAMNAVKGLFADGAGNFTIKRQPDREMAIRLMNDKAYHLNKVAIMQPIDEFYTMFAERTAGDVAQRERRSMRLLAAMAVLIFVMAGIMAFSAVAVWRQFAQREKIEAALAAQDRSRAGQAALNERLRGEHTTAELATSVVSFLCDHLHANVGALYISQDGALRLAGSYALPPREESGDEFHPGEGLVGQALLQKKFILMTDCPPDYLTIRSSFGSAVPKNILVYPLLLNKEVEAIIELGAFREFEEGDLSFLAATAENIAIALQTVMARAKREELLEKTQQQAEELQTQQEELRASNEELEEQTKALRVAEELMQVNQQELRMANEELSRRTETLEKQQQEILKKGGSPDDFLVIWG